MISCYGHTASAGIYQRRDIGGRQKRQVRKNHDQNIARLVREKARGAHEAGIQPSRGIWKLRYIGKFRYGLLGQHESLIHRLPEHIDHVGSHVQNQATARLRR